MHLISSNREFDLSVKKIMYNPPHFEIINQEEIFAFIEANAFGQLISSVEGRLFSTHLPILVAADHSRLLGHMAKANPQWRDIDGQEVLITLPGPHDYISPSWYCSSGVPTWCTQGLNDLGLIFAGTILT